MGDAIWDQGGVRGMEEYSSIRNMVGGGQSWVLVGVKCWEV